MKMKSQNGFMPHQFEEKNSPVNNTAFQMNCRGPPPPTLLKYVIINRKKIFILLCAFMMGTWIGSSFPYYQFSGHRPMGEHTCSAEGMGHSVLKSKSKLLNAPQDESTTRRMQVQNEKTGKTWRTNESYETQLQHSNISGFNKAFKKSKNKDPSGSTTVVDIHVKNDTGSEYLVYTPSCKIPNFNPWDPSIQHAIRRLEKLHCGNRHQLTYMENNYLKINDSVLDMEYDVRHENNVSCCYRTVRRSEEIEADDDSILISNKCLSFSNKTFISEEFIKVECLLNQTYKLVDFHYTIPENPTVESRCNTSALPNSTSDTKFSVMIFGLDAVSKLNFERHMQRTRRYLVSALGAVEMVGYNKVGDNTFPNLVPLLSGMSQDRLTDLCWTDKTKPFDDCPWVWKAFRESGYRTLYGEDSTHISTFNYLKPGFKVRPTDYYLRPLMHLAETTEGWKKHLNTKLCLGPNPLYETPFRWAAQFMKRFEARPYFGLVWSNSLTHDDDDFVQNADDFFADLISDLHSGGQLNKTVLIFVSDHGIRWGALRETLIGRYEERLPALYVSLPEAFRRQFPELRDILVANSNRLTSPFDLHATLVHVQKLAGDRTEAVAPPAVGQSLFQLVPLNRTCEMAGINAHWCACQESVAMNLRHPESLSLARFVLRYLNNETREHRHVCAPLSLVRIISILRTTNVQLHEDARDEYYYAVTLQTTPGGGIFEGTVRVSAENATRYLDSDVSRLNLYGEQSWCVEEVRLKKTCFCPNRPKG